MGSAADKLDLPVATSGFDQWIGVVAKAMTFGAKDQQQAVDNLKKFQSQVQGHLSKTVSLTEIPAAKYRQTMGKNFPLALHVA